MQTHTFHIRCGRGPHALPRLLLIFARRRLSPETLFASAVDERLAEIRLSCRCEPAEARQLLAQLQRQVEVESATLSATARALASGPHRRSAEVLAIAADASDAASAVRPGAVL